MCRRFDLYPLTQYQYLQ